MSSSAVTFKDLGLVDQLVETCNKLGYTLPTAIQAEAIPLALAKHDVIGLAQTGSGKTAAFALPILQSLLLESTRSAAAMASEPPAFYACVLAPTRELAIQIGQSFDALGADICVKTAVLVGGIDMMQQALMLARKPHIIVATPGRLIDHLERTKGFNLKHLKWLVMDEADRLLDMDFGDEIDKLLKVIPKVGRHTLLFSATMTSKVSKLQRASLVDPVRVEVSASKYQTVDSLIQHYLFVPSKFKDAWCIWLLNELAGQSAIVFAATCQSAQRCCLILRNLGFNAVAIHGQLTQGKRLAALNHFKAASDGQNMNSSLVSAAASLTSAASGASSVDSLSGCILVATDVASRGLDIPSVDLVINYDVPNNAKDYVHRVGRTARAGRSGRSVTLVTQYDIEPYQKIEECIGKKLDEFPSADKEAVLMLAERVAEAQRYALKQMRMEEESAAAKGKTIGRADRKGGKGKKGKIGKVQGGKNDSEEVEDY